jgi:hypothetical protein
VGAITFEERETAAFDKAAASPPQNQSGGEISGGCENLGEAAQSSRPASWPVQLKLVSAKAAFFDGAHVLISADCAAYRYENFYRDFIKNSAGHAVTLIGCPKLDNVDYSVKLSEIVRHNNIESITLVKMEVPCCGGLSWALKQALAPASASVDAPSGGKEIPVRTVTVSVAGGILKPEEL